MFTSELTRRTDFCQGPDAHPLSKSFPLYPDWRWYRRRDSQLIPESWIEPRLAVIIFGVIPYPYRRAYVCRYLWYHPGSGSPCSKGAQLGSALFMMAVTTKPAQHDHAAPLGH